MAVLFAILKVNSGSVRSIVRACGRNNFQAFQRQGEPMSRLKTIEWVNTGVRIVDQTRLPTTLVYEDITTVEEMWDAIKVLKVRGAPAIGIAAGYGLYLGIRDFKEEDPQAFMDAVHTVSEYLSGSRPTAVNLFWALKRMVRTAHAAQTAGTDVKGIKKRLWEEAEEILAEDKRICRQIGENGFDLLKEYSSLLTHCNAGGLATGEYGTALAPVYVGLEKGKLFQVYADETRPLLQGARITAFELREAGVPVTLICDNMAPVVMREGKVQAVIVGADRIAANGDTANKIGTYGVALAARAHNIPFFVAAPSSTFDKDIPSGKEIPIEERESREIVNGFGTQTAPDGIDVYNPAFDVTPAEMIQGIITEKGVLTSPYEESVRTLWD